MKKQRQYLKDYRPSAWQVPKMRLQFDVQEDHVLVQTYSQFVRVADSLDEGNSLRLDGRQIELISVSIDGKRLSADAYSVDDQGLSLANLPAQFELHTSVKLDPYNNSSLEGLYYAGGILCTQCESHGFSRITYALDRPDVMSIYQVEIIADKGQFPILLSNGERHSIEELAEGRHAVRWSDPHPKPSYLFAMVAGDMACKSRPYSTSEGREVDVAFYCDHGIENRMDHAIDSLIRAMQWDEQRYGLAYDLNTYNVVVAGAFNMGAMENKGLNIFNPKYVLADALTATDADFAAVESVIGHEYFHNWTGNRVTCRDWFQLSLKEGLTVFRDQQFSADCGAGPRLRTEQVRALRARQFAEDAGPLAHPVRPLSYLEMNNFYTSTVYEKGAELVRLLHARVGEAGFRKGMDLYFERHDGQAVTIEDFLNAHGDANDLDTSGILQWYNQAGTPLVQIRDEYRDGQYHLHCEQSVPSNPAAQPVLIPIRLNLLGADGRSLLDSQVVEFQQATQSFSFAVDEAPTPVLFEGFSAPVVWQYAYTDQQLACIVRHAQDPFSRWDAAQRIYIGLIERLYQDPDAPRTGLEVFTDVLNGNADPSVIASLLNPPGADELAMRFSELQPLKLAAAVTETVQALATLLAPLLPAKLNELENKLRGKSYRFEPEAAAQRSLRARLLNLWVTSADEQAANAAQQLYQNADNLTDRMAALSALNQSDFAQRQTLLDRFYADYKSDKLVLDRWFSLQAQRHGESGLNAVESLLEHADFDSKNPNRVRAVIAGFGMLNLSALYAGNGRGVMLLTQQILRFDASNPQLAARLITPFASFKTLAQPYQEHVRAALQQIVEQAVSPDVQEQAQRMLNPD